MPRRAVGLRTVSGHPVSHWSPMTDPGLGTAPSSASSRQTSPPPGSTASPASSTYVTGSPSWPAVARSHRWPTSSGAPASTPASPGSHLPVLDGDEPHHASGLVPDCPACTSSACASSNAMSSGIIHDVGRDAPRIADTIASRDCRRSTHPPLTRTGSART